MVKMHVKCHQKRWVRPQPVLGHDVSWQCRCSVPHQCCPHGAWWVGQCGPRHAQAVPGHQPASSAPVQQPAHCHWRRSGTWRHRPRPSCSGLARCARAANRRLHTTTPNIMIYARYVHSGLHKALVWCLSIPQKQHSFLVFCFFLLSSSKLK